MRQIVRVVDEMQRDEMRRPLRELQQTCRDSSAAEHWCQEALNESSSRQGMHQCICIDQQTCRIGPQHSTGAGLPASSGSSRALRLFKKLHSCLAYCSWGSWVAGLSSFVWLTVAGAAGLLA
jgi:hypothetical protein